MHDVVSTPHDHDGARGEQARIQQRPAVIVFDGCALSEVIDFLSLFQDTAPALIVAGAHDGRIRTLEGLTVLVETSISQVQPSQFDPIVIAGGDVAAAIHDAQLMAFLMAAFADTPTVIGGICNGAWLMAAAGLLHGKRCTHTGHPSCNAPDEVVATAKPLFEKAQYVAEDVVTDGRLITAKPWARGDFTLQVARLAGLVEDARMEPLRAYLRGEYRP